MATKKTYAKLLSQFEPTLRAGFLASINEITSKVLLAEVISALNRGNVTEAIAALHIEPAAFEAFRDARAAAYIAAGKETVATLPPRPGVGPMIVRFDARAPLAEQWLGRDSSRWITRLTEEQQQVARNFLEAGMVRGDNPRTVALDLVGRIDPQLGRRTNGLLGLSLPQEQAWRNARLALSSPETMAQFLNNKLRDHRYDPWIEKALRDGVPLTPEQQQLMLQRYSDRLLKHRGDTVARTEMMAALHAGTRQAYQEAIDAGHITKEEIKRTWDSTGDRKVRSSHEYLDGQEVGFDEPYVTESGVQIMFPGDPTAPVSEIANCRCNELYRIDFLARAIRNME